MTDGTEKTKIPLNFPKCTARYDEFCCNLCLKAVFTLGALSTVSEYGTRWAPI